MTERQVAVITGGTGGLGAALTRRLVGRGDLLAVTYLVPEEAAQLEQELDLDEDRLLLHRVDVNDPEAITEFMKGVVDHFGALHKVAALVGGWAGGRDVEETDDVRFERMIDLNLRSAFYTLRAAIPHLRRTGWGRVVVTGSKAAHDTPPGQAAYNAAKAAVMALARTVAQELEDTNITVNAVVPSVIDTPATRAAMPFADYVSWPQPADIAPVIDFLLSEEAAVISGAAIQVYGRA